MRNRRVMSLRACSRCGGTLTDVFHFCPACGHAGDEPGWPTREDATATWPLEPLWAVERNAPVSFPVVERPRRTPAARRRPGGAALRAAAGRAGQRVLRMRRPSFRPVAVRARARLAACGEAATLLLELVLITLASVRDGLRSTVMLRKLHAQRAAVIYASGCAALNGDSHGVEHARAELRMLDELITAVGGRIPPETIRP